MIKGFRFLCIFYFGEIYAGDNWWDLPDVPTLTESPETTTSSSYYPETTTSTSYYPETTGSSTRYPELNNPDPTQANEESTQSPPATCRQPEMKEWKKEMENWKKSHNGNSVRFRT